MSGASADSYQMKFRIFGEAVHSIVQRFTSSGAIQRIFNHLFLFNGFVKFFSRIPFVIESVTKCNYSIFFSIYAQSILNIVYRSFFRRFKIFGITDSKNVKNILSVFGDSVHGKNILFSVNGYNIFKKVYHFINISINAIKTKSNVSVIGNIFADKIHRFLTIASFYVNHTRDFFVYSTVLNPVVKFFSVTSISDFSLHELFFVRSLLSIQTRNIFNSFGTFLTKKLFVFNIHSASSNSLSNIISISSSTADFFKSQILTIAKSTLYTSKILSIRSSILSTSKYFWKSAGETIRNRQKSFKIFGTKEKLMKKILRSRGIVLSSINFVFSVRSAIGSMLSKIFSVFGLTRITPKEIFSLNADVQNDHQINFYLCRANSKELMYIKLNYNRNQKTFKSQKFFNGKRWFN